MRTARKILFVFLLFSILCSLFSVSLAHAQDNQASSQSNSTYNIPNTNPDVPKNQHMYTQSVMIEVLSAFACQLTGSDPVNPNQKCLGIDRKTNKIGFVENGGGAIAAMGQVIAATFELPVHTGDYVSYMASNFGISKPAYAQSKGFESLRPLMKIWVAFRDIVYLFFVIVFLIIGVAIMFRVKIDPRTVMSLENQIPKIIVGILLVTFSMAIAGLLIDLMYIIIYLIFNILADPKTVDNAEGIKNAQATFNGDNALGVMNQIVGFWNVVNFSGSAVQKVVQGLFSVSGANFFDFIQNGLAALLGGIVAILGMVVIAVAILWAMFRLWFTLIGAYVFILIDIVIAPFLIISAVIPGAPGIGGWLRDLIANLLAFPLTIFLFLLGRIFMDSFQAGSANAFVPPLIGNPGNSQAIGYLIGLGIILLTPQVVAMMKDALKAPPFKYTAGVGQAVGKGGGFINIPSHASKLGQFGYQWSHIPRVGGAIKSFLGKGGASQNASGGQGH